VDRALPISLPETPQAGDDVRRAEGIALAESLDDPRMVDAFRGIYLIRLDYDEWERSLPGTDFRVVGVPTFYEVDASGLPTGRMLTGAAWGEDIVENMAPVLKDFFAGG
jgi:hypothetical protein